MVRLIPGERLPSALIALEGGGSLTPYLNHSKLDLLAKSSKHLGLAVATLLRRSIFEGEIHRTVSPCLQHGPDLSDGYFPSNPSVSRTR